MIGKKMREAMNDQIKYELESAYLYLSMAAYFHGQGFDGMAQWMRAQTMEEMVHAMKFFDHLKDRDGHIALQPLAIAKTEWASPLEAFREAYKHEQFITSRINELMAIAHEERDYAATVLLHWFVAEQVEEEASTSRVAQMLERVGDHGNGLLQIDRELGSRVFVMPPAAGGPGEAP